MYSSKIFPAGDFRQMKQKVLNWVQQFDTFCFLDNHQYQLEPHAEECLLGAGVKRYVKAAAGEALPQLQQLIDERPSWLFGHLSYDLKNETAPLQSDHVDGVGFADLFFFEPEILIRLDGTSISIDAEDPAAVFAAIQALPARPAGTKESIRLRNRVKKTTYLSIIDKLRKHIQRGDCYEINFCQEFYAKNVAIDPLQVYDELSNVSPNPFSCLYRQGHQWLLCASPERFLRRKGDTVLSQPIKGTSRRIPADKKQDQQSRDDLYNSAKDRSENVMIVDLVRNDLAQVCREASVQVDELYGIYSFPQVHQMISTISGKIRSDVNFTDIIRATFPMGSMTGAPKRRVMQLVEEYEKTRRGLFSGAVGYMTPEGDFDFNVVIRSILYNAQSGYLSIPVGSGITFYSDPEKEWEECIMKIDAIGKILR